LHHTLRVASTSVHSSLRVTTLPAQFNPPNPIAHALR